MKLNLGTFEYGTKARWSIFVVICCFLPLLMLPAIAEATTLTRVSGRTIRSSSISPNWGFFHVHTTGHNHCSRNPMRVRTQRINNADTAVGVTVSVALQPGRSGNTPVVAPIPGQQRWRCQIEPVSGLEFFGSARLVR